MTHATTARWEVLLEARRYAEAAQSLTQAANVGDASALAELAHWHISGDIIRRDLSKARGLLERAGKAGNIEAALLHASFLASGTGGAADWKSASGTLRAVGHRHPRVTAQLQLLDAMALTDDGHSRQTLVSQQLSLEPFVSVFRAFLTPAECSYLIEQGWPMLQPSLVFDPATGRMIPHPIRSSEAALFGVYAEDLVVNAINRRIAAATSTEAAQGEPLQLLRYGPGGQYRDHMDALPGEKNQRVMTMLIYLSDNYGGGETTFTRAGIRFKGRTGDALLFRNTTSGGAPDPNSMHAGSSVTTGIKLIASRWIRARPFTFPAPTPLLREDIGQG